MKIDNVTITVSGNQVSDVEFVTALIAAGLNPVQSVVSMSMSSDIDIENVHSQFELKRSALIETCDILLMAEVQQE